VAGGSNGGVNGINAIEGGGEVKRGSDGGVVKAQAASEVELGSARSGRRWWRHDRAPAGQR
jgi:hypothetical protein